MRSHFPGDFSERSPLMFARAGGFNSCGIMHGVVILWNYASADVSQTTTFLGLFFSSPPSVLKGGIP